MKPEEKARRLEVMNARANGWISGLLTGIFFTALIAYFLVNRP